MVWASCPAQSAMALVQGSPRRQQLRGWLQQLNKRGGGDAEG
eukprot:CAMPEP_0202901964 /NCGR_PEP_ID=MMETSP1392-20130828/15597_1 /ASSEMBLY_ACC=CAM_ASM_000868 /TAXON_ID=225041 /ORGANISM="Chlamydomonas chlamydogama, Strain SAG 11-48b" /LENGTH=41 /DNA_ID= /DNA_START= /DNA_END= /DNA_ORIENTATION=